MIQALCRLFFARKQLILLKKSDLSTEISAFTITTIFIYQSIVNRQKKRERRRFFQQTANSAKKKALTATLTVTAKPSAGIRGRSWSTCWPAIRVRQQHGGKAKNRGFCWLLWITACISTGRDVGKVVLCPQANFYPKQVLPRYNAYAAPFSGPK